MSKNTKVLVAVTVSDSVIFLFGMPMFFHDKGYELAISSGPGVEHDYIKKNEGAKVFEVGMSRDIDILNDLKSLFKVFKVIREFKPDIVNAGTPKAGFIYMLASWVLRVPSRVYHVRGLRHESLEGNGKKLQVLIEKLCGLLCTHVICETHSLKNLSLKEKLYPKHKCYVLGPGSSGIELEKFDPSSFDELSKKTLKRSIGIPEDALVIGYLGRVVPRKGIHELLTAWQDLKKTHENAYLLIAGPYENSQPINQHFIDLIDSDHRIIFLGRVSDVAKYYSIMDLFTLPAHWEGFGNVLVEAAAMGVPVITTNGTGTVDAVNDNYNGKVVPVRDVKALHDALDHYLNDSDERSLHGKNGLIWSKNFDRKSILMFLLDFYNKIR